MKCLFFILVGITLFFSFSAGHITPAIVVNHDKLAHFVVFLVLSCCMSFSFPESDIKNLIIAMILLAVGIEVFQYLFTYREMSVLDLVASMAGIFVCMIIQKFLITRQDNIIDKNSNISL